MSSANEKTVSSYHLYTETCTMNNQIQPFITTFTVKNFKSLVDVKLELGQINVFIGANGSGKSNLLEAMALFGAAQENRLDPDSLYSKGIRIAKPSLMYSAFKESMALNRLKLLAQLENESLPVTIQLTDEQNYPLVSHWQIQNFGQIIKRIGQQLTYRPLNEYVIYNLETRTLRGLTRESKKQSLGINGEGLDNLLLNFSPAEQEQLKKYSYLIEWLEEIVLDEADNYKREGLKQGRGVSKLYFKDRFMSVDNNVLSAENSNEGILHVLFYLALFISRQTPQLFAIDNIESSLNPHLCRHLIEQLCELAKTNRKQALITTHNPAILDGLNLNDEAIRLFIVNRDDETGQTQVERLQAKPRPDNERKHIKLSELWMKGYIGAIPEDF